jgi:hypothetical protein
MHPVGFQQLQQPSKQKSVAEPQETTSQASDFLAVEKRKGARILSQARPENVTIGVSSHHICDCGRFNNGFVNQQQEASKSCHPNTNRAGSNSMKKTVGSSGATKTMGRISSVSSSHHASKKVAPFDAVHIVNARQSTQKQQSQRDLDVLIGRTKRKQPQNLLERSERQRLVKSLHRIKRRLLLERVTGGSETDVS